MNTPNPSCTDDDRDLHNSQFSWLNNASWLLLTHLSSCQEACQEELLVQEACQEELLDQEACQEELLVQEACQEELLVQGACQAGSWEGCSQPGAGPLRAALERKALVRRPRHTHPSPPGSVSSSVTLGEETGINGESRVECLPATATVNTSWHTLYIVVSYVNYINLGSFVLALSFFLPRPFQESPPCHRFPIQCLSYQVLHLGRRQWSLCVPLREFESK